MWAAMNIGNNTRFINISIDSENIEQKATQSLQSFDYQMVKMTLGEIAELFDIPKFQRDFGDKADEVVNLVEKLLKEFRKENEPTVLKKGFARLKKLAGKVGSSIIADAFCEGVKKILGLF